MTLLLDHTIYICLVDDYQTELLKILDFHEHFDAYHTNLTAFKLCGSLRVTALEV